MTGDKRPVIFRRPENWDLMTPGEKFAFALAIAEAMGIPDDDPATDD